MDFANQHIMDRFVSCDLKIVSHPIPGDIQERVFLIITMPVETFDEILAFYKVYLVEGVRWSVFHDKSHAETPV